MRNVFIGFLFLVAIWIGWGAPVPGVRLSQMTPDPSLPTFQPVTKGDERSIGATVRPPRRSSAAG